MWYILSTIFFIVFYIFILRSAKYDYNDEKYKFSIGFYCIVIIVSMIPVVRIGAPIFYRLSIYEDMFYKESFYIPIFRKMSNFFKIKI